jgi:hypothetical protein
VEQRWSGLHVSQGCVRGARTASVQPRLHDAEHHCGPRAVLQPCIVDEALQYAVLRAPDRGRLQLLRQLPGQRLLPLHRERHDGRTGQLRRDSGLFRRLPRVQAKRFFHHGRILRGDLYPHADGAHHGRRRCAEPEGGGDWQRLHRHRGGRLRVQRVRAQGRRRRLPARRRFLLEQALQGHPADVPGRQLDRGRVRSTHCRDADSRWPAQPLQQ